MPRHAKGGISGVESTVTLELVGDGSIGVQVTGTWAGTLTFEASVDGSIFQAINTIATNGSSLVTTTTANGVWQGSVAAMKTFRVRASAWTSGLAVVSLESVDEPPGTYLGAVTGAITVAESADVNAGATTDAKVTGDNDGTLSAKRRGLNYLINLATDTEIAPVTAPK